MPAGPEPETEPRSDTIRIVILLLHETAWILLGICNVMPLGKERVRVFIL